MKHILVNKEKAYTIQVEGEYVLINGNPIHMNLKRCSEDSLHLLVEGKSYNTEIIAVNYKEKEAEIKINGQHYWVSLNDEKNTLLRSLGMEPDKAQRASHLKAPMPGLVLEVLVKEGDRVNKGDCLLVLEAMKMENLIKSPSEITIKSIEIKTGDKVEKNQVLIQFADPI